MCSGSIGSVIDPANIAGKRKGGLNMAGALDPGGKIVKDVTGSDIASKAGDPGGLFKSYDSEEAFKKNEAILSTYGTTAAERADKARNAKSIFGTPQKNQGTIF